MAASSTPMVVRFRCSTPSDPTMASAWFSSPHIFKHCSTLQFVSTGKKLPRQSTYYASFSDSGTSRG